MFNRIAASLLLLLLLFCSSAAESKKVDPYIQKLEQTAQTGDEGLAEILTEIEKAPDSANKVLIPWLKSKNISMPAIFTLMLGKKVFPQNKKEGLKWYELGLFRLKYDVLRCSKPEDVASDAFLLYSQITMEDLAPYDKPDKVKEAYDAMREALSWEKKHPYTGSPTWLCTYLGSSVTPESSWPEIYQRKLESAIRGEKDGRKHGFAVKYYYPDGSTAD